MVASKIVVRQWWRNRLPVVVCGSGGGGGRQNCGELSAFTDNRF